MSAFIPVSPRSAVWLMLAGLSMAWLAGSAAAQTPAAPASAPANHAPAPAKPAPKTPTIPAPAGPTAKPGTAAHTKAQGHPGKTPPAAHKKVGPTPAPAAAPPLAPKPAEPEAEKPPEPQKGGTGLPLPRFAALRSDDVNMRAGPGTRYPIDWVYKRRDLPVEIEREFEVWRLVRDPDGTKGWVHQATLTGRRTLIVTGATRSLRKQPDAQAPEVAQLKLGVLGRIRSCEAGSEWCQVQIGDYRGFLRRTDFWGTQPGEVIAN